MKKTTKFLASVLACGALAGAAVGLTACRHEHTWNTAWESDETSHWHTCADETCTEVDAKAEHTFGEGTVTKQPNYTQEGEKTVACTVCGYEKTETVAALAMKGTSILAAQSTMVDANGSTLPITTTLTVDFDKKEAVLEVVASVDVGGGYIMDFCFVTDEKDPDLEAANPMYYMSVMEIGKATLEKTGAGAYTASWADDLSVPVSVDAEGGVSAAVQVTGIHAEALPLEDVTEVTGSTEMTGSHTDLGTGGIEYTYDVILTADFSTGEAVLTISTTMDLGGGYMQEFVMVTDQKGDDPMKYMQCIEIGKGTITRTGAYTFEAVWSITDAATGETSDYTVTIKQDGEGTYSASVAFEGLFSAPASVTSK